MIFASFLVLLGEQGATGKNASVLLIAVKQYDSSVIVEQIADVLFDC